MVMRPDHPDETGARDQSGPSPVTKTTPTQRPLGTLLVTGAVSLWVGVLLFTVGPFGTGDEPTSDSATAPGTLASNVSNPRDDAELPRQRGRSPEPNLIAAAQREPAPGFALPDLNGNDATLGDYREQVLLLNFWATWCQPCRAEMPWFIEFQESFADDGFSVLGVSVDEPGWEIVRPFLERTPVNYRIALADTLERQAPFGVMNVLPTTWLIDRRGRIAAEHVGLVSRQGIEAEIQQLLREDL